MPQKRNTQQSFFCSSSVFFFCFFPRVPFYYFNKSLIWKRVRVCCAQTATRKLHTSKMKKKALKAVWSLIHKGRSFHPWVLQIHNQHTAHMCGYILLNGIPNIFYIKRTYCNCLWNWKNLKNTLGQNRHHAQLPQEGSFPNLEFISEAAKLIYANQTTHLLVLSHGFVWFTSKTQIRNEWKAKILLAFQ